MLSEIETSGSAMAFVGSDAVDELTRRVRFSPLRVVRSDYPGRGHPLKGTVFSTSRCVFPGTKFVPSVSTEGR